MRCLPLNRPTAGISAISRPLEGKREYFGDTFCCPNNFRRIIAELPGMVCYRSGDGVAVNLFTPSTANIQTGRRAHRHDSTGDGLSQLGPGENRRHAVGGGGVPVAAAHSPLVPDRRS